MTNSDWKLISIALLIISALFFIFLFEIIEVKTFAKFNRDVWIHCLEKRIESLESR